MGYRTARTRDRTLEVSNQPEACRRNR
jgi:hypothetical protein